MITPWATCRRGSTRPLSSDPGRRRRCAKETLRHPEFLAVRRDVHAIGPPGTLIVPTTHLLRVDQRHGVLDAIAQEPVATITLGPEIARRPAGFQAPGDRPSRGLTTTRPSCPVRATSSRLSGSMGTPAAPCRPSRSTYGLGLEVERHQPPRLLQRDEHRLRLGVEREMARHAVHENTIDELGIRRRGRNRHGRDEGPR